jgi:hypothetical protein
MDQISDALVRLDGTKGGHSAEANAVSDDPKQLSITVVAAFTGGGPATW